MRWLFGGLLALAVLSGCGDDDGRAPDGGADAGALDGGVDAGPADASFDAGPPPPALCAICRSDADCDDGALCLVLADGERGCGLPCEGDADCEGLGMPASCEEEVPGLPIQCRPTAETCVITQPGASCTDDADCEGRYDRCVDADGLGAVCTTACRVDADCPLGMHRCDAPVGGEGHCVPDPLPAAERCLARAELAGIARCEDDGSCPIGGTCAGTGGLRLCLQAPTGGLEDPCGPWERPVVFEGTELCAPEGCDCMFGQLGAMLDDALAQVGLDRCDLHYASNVVDLLVPEVSHDPYRLAFTEQVWGDWPEAVPFAEHVTGRLDAAATGDLPLAPVLNVAGGFADLRESGGMGAVDDLSAALVSLIETAGGTADPALVDAQVAALDAGLAAGLADVVEAIRQAHLRREEALARFGPEDRQRLFDGVGALYLDNLDRLELRRTDLRGALLGDVDLERMLAGASGIGAAVDRAALPSFAGSPGDLTVETPLGRVAVRGGSATHQYDDAEWHRTLLLVDLGGDDTYRFPAGATTAVDHGVAVVVDVGGTDEYGYDVVAHPRDEGPAGHTRLPSDADGRNDPPAGATAGPSSRSGTARQGAGRLGIGMLVDLGAEADHYRSLRMSQGYGALGIGLLYDAGGDDVYEGEAAVQGAAGFGVGVLVDRGGNDRYVAYHAAQGFAYARATGALWDGGGDDAYFMHPSDVLYWSPQDPGGSNSSLGQGMGFGRRGDRDRVYMSGGLGVLRDRSGIDRYTAGIFAQASGYWFGTGLLVDSDGDDHYDAQWYAQSGSAHFAISVLLDEAGNDTYNASARRQNVTLGGGHDFSVAWMIDRAGSDAYHAPNLSFGAGNEAGAGFFLDGAGVDTYEGASDFSFGNAYVRPDDTLRKMVFTLGVFLDADGADTYVRPTTPPPENDGSWTQSRNGDPTELGVGLDRTSGDLGI